MGLQSSAVGWVDLGLISCSPATSCLSSISLECGSPGARDLRKDTSAFLTEEREVRPLLPRHLLFLSLIIWKFLDLVTPLTLLLQLSCQWGSFGPQDSLWGGLPSTEEDNKEGCHLLSAYSVLTLSYVCDAL